MQHEFNTKEEIPKVNEFEEKADKKNANYDSYDSLHLYLLSNKHINGFFNHFSSKSSIEQPSTFAMRYTVSVLALLISLRRCSYI